MAEKMLAVDDLKTRMPLTDAEIATNYDETKESFATPERRRVQQLTFKDKAAAEAAKTAIDGGKNFMTVAQELGLKDSDVELGLVKKVNRGAKLLVGFEDFRSYRHRAARARELPLESLRKVLTVSAVRRDDDRGPLGFQAVFGNTGERRPHEAVVEAGDVNERPHAADSIGGRTGGE